jgi:hypothetical protein
MNDIVGLNKNDSYFLATLAALSEQASTVRDILNNIN